MCLDLAALFEEGYEVAITHGNGPQVGNILLRIELSAHQVYPLPLDVCVADTQGGMGYMIQQQLANVLHERRLSRPVVTVLTQVVVDAKDPAFKKPTKPVGPAYTRERAEALSREHGFYVAEDAEGRFVRVVASPYPLEIVEIDMIRRLLDSGAAVIAAGGGGVPVVRDEGLLRGVEAVVDKDYSSSLLAREIDADLLVIATSVDRVVLSYRKPDARPVSRLTAEEAEKYLREGHFPPGSMGPKIEGALAFLKAGGGEVIITNVESLPSAIRGGAGTHVVP